MHSIIYIIVTPELDLQKAVYSHNYTIHPIFRTRRCLSKLKKIFDWVYNYNKKKTLFLKILIAALVAV